MADFRKWLFAFAVLALMLGASTAYAQIPGGGGSVVCNISPANPTIVSVENITALVGDFVLICNGGTPTPTGQIIPQDNITLTLNQNITSRLLAGGYIDALLTIDEPFPTTALGGTPHPLFGTTAQQVIGSPTGQTVCYSVQSNTVPNASSPASCNVMKGTYNPGTFLFNGSPYDPSNAAASSQDAQVSNIFVAHATSNPGQVTWLGVPIDAPGTAGSRIIRMTNIRANACAAGLSGGLVPTQINGFVSFNGGQNVIVSQSQQTLAYVQQGLIVSATSSNFVQCTNLNSGGGGAGGNFGGTTKLGIPTMAVTLTEGYAAAFKRQTAAFAPIGDLGQTAPPPGPQNIVGLNYNSESGFEPTGNAPGALGTATQGDRFLLVFNNVGTGVNLWVPQYVALAGGLPSPGNDPASAVGKVWAGGWLQLVGTASDLNGNVSSLAPSSTSSFLPGANAFIASNPFKGPQVAPFTNAVQLTGSGNVFTAVYEVENADPSAIESATIPVGVAFISNTASNLPAPGTSTVTASMAPLSTVNVASSTDPIPRWCNKSSAINAFKINLCTCNLLFPFVTNIGGFDTGIAIANTSLDTTYNVAAQNGNVTLNFYGSLPGTPAPAPITPQTTSTTVKAGEELLFTLSSGGDHGIQQETGFTGYIIAVANFQFCHGFAFISDLGAQKLAEGYLAIELDTPQWSAAGIAGIGATRTGIINENQGH